ncbi:MAG TPA: hypothetical protein PKG77_14110 [Phycisphaerae bacterium]|nr:hypothetical protein [Phycisphaerae bacterium]HQL74957.1 hypothetical protein [Phycisphaerae bacterium]
MDESAHVHVPGRRSFAALSAVAATLAAWQAAVVATALARVPLTGGLAQAVLLGGLGAGAIAYFLLQSPPLRGGLSCDDGSVLLALPLRVVLWLVVALAAGAYVALWVVAYVYPDWSWDGNAYHLPVVHFWARAGYVHWIDPALTNADLMNGYPKGAEVIQFLLVRALGDGRLDNVANLVFLPLGVLGLLSAGRSLGAARPAAAAAAAVYVLLPVTIGQSPTTYVDSAYASCAIAMLACLVRGWTLLQAHGRVPWAVLPALGLSGGLAAAVKPVGPLLAALTFAAMGMMVLLWARSRRPRARLAPAAALLAAAAGLAVLVGGYWYVRNLYHAGSPLYPGGLYLAGRQVFPGKTVEQLVFPAFSTPPELRPLHPLVRLAATWSQAFGWPDNIAGHDARLGGLGFLWLGGCVPAILLALTGVLRPARPAGFRTTWLLLILVAAAALAVTPMNWWARYALWLYALGLPLLALLVSQVLAKPRVPELAHDPTPACHSAVFTTRRSALARVPVALWLLALAGLLGFESVKCLRHLHAEAARPWAIRPAPASTDDRPLLMFYPVPDLAGTAFDELLAAGEPLAVGPLGGNNRCLLGQLATPPGRREIIPLPAQPSPGDLARLRSRGVRTVIWDRTPAESWDASAPASASQYYCPLPDCLATLPRTDLGTILLIRLDGLDDKSSGHKP